ncbi:MAG: dUTP diphosphatase [Thermoplasmata archaeon]|nr:MAG: dUTP diphosphatase [Thermoplasmata archaeon]
MGKVWSDSTTELKVMREDVAGFIRDRDWGRYHAPVNVASAAAVEAGELLELFQWRRSGDPVPEDVMAEAGSEMADVLHFTLCLANATGLELPADRITFSQLLADAEARDLGPKEAAEEVMVGASFLLMAARASSLTREIADTLGEGATDDAMAASVMLLLEALAKCARALGLNLSAELYAKNRLNEERYPVGSKPAVGY